MTDISQPLGQRTRATVRRAHNTRLTSVFMLIAPLFLIGTLFALPIALILLRSVLDPTFTLENYSRILNNAGYINAFVVSLKIAFWSTLISLVLSYPLAWVLIRSSPRVRNLMMIVILLPFWTNILIRVYAWMVVLQNSGLINTLLGPKLGIISTPVPLVFNFTGVMIGMVHYLVPMHILVLYGTMRSIDLRLLNAAIGLGANPLRAFLHVFVPLSMTGTIASAVLIFVVALGFYVTPALLGGSNETTVSMLIGTFFSDVVDWEFGSALSVVLLLLILLGLSLLGWLRKQERGRAA
ncbi:ABC transporter permease [Brucella sp. NBRC 12950]|uniref:ABC transporter permease n=1 Tax=Brucella sp. NBRC 12950 TaxID=2994518 RepID=UPI0024A14188|nr:ABC transporter permease [Brucella sp. NBRC 12950]GLU30012.1 ABC transporter permease [Brucella sp. NBRC 12950]